jgi:uncharacterized protein (UPF0332 family)
LKEEFLSKTEENLKIAQISFEHKCYNACANRAYFAAFQAAIAALIHKGIKRGNFDHKWVQAEFNEKLIRRQKIYPSRLRSYLLKMQLLRNMADYEHDTVSRKEAAEQFRKAEEIITFIRKEIRK